MKRLLYRLYLVVIFCPLFLISTVLAVLATAVGSLISPRIFTYYPGMLWSRIALYVMLCPVTVKGRENIKQGVTYIVTPNHTSALDIFMMYGYFGAPFKWVMKGSLRKIPLVGWACERCGFVFVNNSSLKDAHRVIKKSESALKSGYHLFIFPEGSRTDTGKLTTLKKGAFKMSYDTNAPILPVTIKGAYKALHRTAIWPNPQRLELEFYPALDPSDFEANSEGLKNMMDAVRIRLQNADV